MLNKVKLKVDSGYVCDIMRWRNIKVGSPIIIIGQMYIYYLYIGELIYLSLGDIDMRNSTTLYLRVTWVTATLSEEFAQLVNSAVTIHLDKNDEKSEIDGFLLLKVFASLNMNFYNSCYWDK